MLVAAPLSMPEDVAAETWFALSMATELVLARSPAEGFRLLLPAMTSAIAERYARVAGLLG
ncbi:hypothetical protein [uncultured Albimonas sp.]|uniref:hypothetical protein n=1 Tax=uncultured Albimonas sp. TaxID=1331701 RepID=UPI0030EBFC38|tara:strand:- start:3044 stop:3226 length:183 start_codon:yes stop_codon:yes gene_type:complete